MTESTWQAAEAMLADWRERYAAVRLAHYRAASRCTAMHYWIGVPAAVFASVVGTTVFATLERGVASVYGKVAVAALSVLAAVLTTLQTFLRYAERAERHRAAAAGYSSVRRRIEVLLTLPAAQRGDVKQVLDEIGGRIDAINEAAPDLPRDIWLAAAGAGAGAGAAPSGTGR